MVDYIIRAEIKGEEKEIGRTTKGIREARHISFMYLLYHKKELIRIYANTIRPSNIVGTVYCEIMEGKSGKPLYVPVYTAFASSKKSKLYLLDVNGEIYDFHKTIKETGQVPFVIK